MKTQQNPTLTASFIPIVLLIILLAFNVILFEDTLAGSNQIALMIAAATAAGIGVRLGFTWSEIRQKLLQTIDSAMPAIIILLLIGALSGTWLISGVIPTLIYYGLDVLHPKIFLFAAVFISMMVSLATGSSWSTIATIGVALLGIGDAMGIDKAIVAGAIVSGAYFGDKMSPLSDTTNLAPAMAGTDLFTHIRYMMYTTIPSITITLILFLIIGFNYEFSSAINDVEKVQMAIAESFNINPVLFLVPVILLGVIIKKMPPIPAIAIGVLLGGIFAIIFQSHIITALAPESTNYFEASYISVMKAVYGSTSIETNNESINRLFSTGGMSGMLNTIWLILSAMIFGGVMQGTGMLKRITHSIIRLARSDASLITATAGSSIFFNITASDQYISIVVPGEMFHDAYRKQGLKPEVLSRTLEDAGTVTSVLIPWNTGGATQAKVLGVATLDYVPYAFFNIISPLMTILFAYLKIKIRHRQDSPALESDR
jgi:NhaC family Na+:H+ antiporter